MKDCHRLFLALRTWGRRDAVACIPLWTALLLMVGGLMALGERVGQAAMPVEESFRQRIEADWQLQDQARVAQIRRPGLVRFAEGELLWPGVEDPAAAGTRLRIPRAAPPVIDGRLDEPAWQKAAVPPLGPADQPVQPAFRLVEDGQRVYVAATFPTWAEACFGPATTAQDAGGAVDGHKNGRYGFHTNLEPNPWWQVDLGARQPVSRIVIYNRLDYPPGLHNADRLVILFSDDGATWQRVYQHPGRPFGGIRDNNPLVVDFASAGGGPGSAKSEPAALPQARFVRIQIPSPTPVFLHFDEVEVYGPANPQKNLALGRPADQSSRSPWSRGGPLCTVGPVAVNLLHSDEGLKVLANGQPLPASQAAWRRNAGTTTVEVTLPLRAMLRGFPEQFVAYHSRPVMVEGGRLWHLRWPDNPQLGFGKNRLVLELQAEEAAAAAAELRVETMVFTLRRPVGREVLRRAVQQASQLAVEFTLQDEGAAAVIATVRAGDTEWREGRVFYIHPVEETLQRAERLGAPAADLQGLRTQAQALAAREMAEGPDPAARAALYRQARWAARRAAFAHPAMQFKELLFVKRFTQQSYPDVCLNHMPWVSRPGGDLCILTLAGPEHEGQVRYLLNGRLGPGHVHGMDLWWDATRVVFGYAKAKSHEPPAGWLDRSQSFRLRIEEEPIHIFEINIDGTNLRQLTSGQWSDLDPTYLPNGDICFVSERCGYSLQCNEYDKDETSTNLYVMRPDGSQIRRLSVTKDGDYLPHTLADGTIGYTRWEYLERGWAHIQSLWTIRPDGTGADALFKQHLNDPWAVEDCRSIPNSNRLVGIATGHHTLPAGPVILINPREGMNSARAIRIVTPGVLPPEGGMSGSAVPEGGVPGTGGYYMTPWPLSETHFLVSSTYRGEYRVAGECDEKGYALYLIDVFGTKELIYRDPEISCFSPIPLRPRPRPPILPDMTDPKVPYAVLAVSNIGKGVPGIDPKRIKYLRIAQGVAWPYCNTYGGQRYEPDVKSVMINWNPVRVLGEVPVEPDGSVHFRVPADEAVYFQILDENYMELRRMRSFISFQPGEVRGCVGCHETRAEAGAIPAVPMASAKEPLDPVPPPWGDVPISFLRDVQPVFDRHCVRCHSGAKPAGGLDFSGGLTARHNRAYDTILEHKLIARSNVGDDARITLPLEFGSHRSRLVEVLRSGPCSQRAKLSKEDWYRLVTWIDANGPYHDGFINKRLPQPPYDLANDAELSAQLVAIHTRRCAPCHAPIQVSRVDWIDLLRPEGSRFLTAPFGPRAQAQRPCSQAVYQSPQEPDYQAVLRLVQTAVRKAWQSPRRDLKALVSNRGAAPGG